MVAFLVNGNKDVWLAKLARETGADYTVAIGDGANDIPMLTEADLGIGFCPKLAVRKKVKHIVDVRDMRKVLNIMSERYKQC